MSGDEIDAIRTRADAALKGPWRWAGDAKNDMYLCTENRGRIFVMRFARLGMRCAQPVFRSLPPDHSEMNSAQRVAIYEVNRQATDINDPSLYRHDIVGLRHPDAEFIAHARQDVDTLLAEVDRLRDLVATQQEAIPA